MEKEIYFVVYSGNHTGKEYTNEIIGVCETVTKAKQMVADLFNEDVKTNDRLVKSSGGVIMMNGVANKFEQASNLNIIPTERVTVMLNEGENLSYFVNGKTVFFNEKGE